MSSDAELKARFDYSKRAGKVDWHVHSYRSDGLDSPTELVRLAKEAGLEEIALTDHDTIAGIEEAQRAGEQSGITVVPGVELNTREMFNDLEASVHILGLGIDPRSPRLIEALGRLATHREEHMTSAVEKLQELGYKITLDEVRTYTKGTLGRPALARALLKRKVNRVRMRQAFSLVKSPKVSDVFTYLISRGKPAYQNVRPAMTIQHAIQLIRDANGLPVLSHPLICESNAGIRQIDEAKLRQYVKEGLGGIELYYYYRIVPYSRLARKRWLALAKELDLACTGGGDYHGKGSKGLAGHLLGKIPYP